MLECRRSGLSGVSRGYESGPRRMNLPLQKITKYSPGPSVCEVVWFKDREDPSNDGKIRPSVDKTRIYLPASFLLPNAFFLLSLTVDGNPYRGPARPIGTWTTPRQRAKESGYPQVATNSRLDNHTYSRVFLHIYRLPNASNPSSRPALFICIYTLSSDKRLTFNA